MRFLERMAEITIWLIALSRVSSLPLSDVARRPACVTADRGAEDDISRESPVISGTRRPVWTRNEQKGMIAPAHVR
jgi:hypothetical protein